MTKVLADKEFAKKMKEIAEAGHDTDDTHMLADDLLVEVLEKLGFHETVKAYNAIHKWYA